MKGDGMKRLPATLAARLATLPRWQWAVVGAVALAIASEAEARVGGGQSYGRRGGGGSYGGSSGGGDGLGILVYYLLRLVIMYPHIGIPLLIVIGFLFYMNQRGQRRAHVGDMRHLDQRVSEFERRPVHAPPRRDVRVLEELQLADPSFSRVILMDFLQLVHRRAWETIGAGRTEALAPFVSGQAFAHLRDAAHKADRIDQVVLAGVDVEKLRVTSGEQRITVRFKGSRRESYGGNTMSMYTEERWEFRRDAKALTLSPEATARLGCPSCGAAIQTDKMGACTNCGTPITAGQLQWQAVSVKLISHRPVDPVDVNVVHEEEGYRMATRLQADYQAQLRAFRGRHPDFDAQQFADRTKHIFLKLQKAWSEQRWDDVRPYLTDQAWHTNRFWLLRYQEQGLVNRHDDVQLERQQVVRIDKDAWYEAVTVRIWASGKDYVVDRSGKVVGGSNKVQRHFSEYWTFVRGLGAHAKTHDPASCPSCGAPLDKINAAGVCGYCDSVVTLGTFDWVLSRIDQPDAYRG